MSGVDREILSPLAVQPRGERDEAPVLVVADPKLLHHLHIRRHGEVVINLGHCR